MTKERNIYVDNLKGLLIILVVVGHFTDIAIDEGSEALKSLFLIIYSFHMPLFIFINGLLCKNIVRDKTKVLIKSLLLGDFMCCSKQFYILQEP